MAELTGSFDMEWWRQVSRGLAIHPAAYPQETVTLTSKSITFRLYGWEVKSLNCKAFGTFVGVAGGMPAGSGSPLTTTARASEVILCREWDSPEEDKAWADL